MPSAANLPVDLVEDILVRLDDAADLVRASAACTAFRRVVSGGRFLRRFRSLQGLHSPPVLGVLCRRSNATVGFRFNPASPPQCSAQAARAVACASGLYSFLSNRTKHGWYVHDARDGRVLLSPGDASTCVSRFSYLVVYDPLHRKHVEIPPIPKDIMACTCRFIVQGSWHCDCEFGPFLVPADDKDDLSFRVMCTVLSSDMEYTMTKLETFMYSSVTGQWRGVASLSDADYELLDRLPSMERNYAHGCFYWVDSHYPSEDMLMLDMNEMKFSVVLLPPRTKGKLKIVVKAAAEDNRIGLLVLNSGNQNDHIHLYTKAFGSANDCLQWRHDAVITIDFYVWSFGRSANQDYALLQRITRNKYVACKRRKFTEKWTPIRKAHYYTLDLKTLVVEHLCVSEFNTDEPASAFHRRLHCQVYEILYALALIRRSSLFLFIS